MPPKSITLTLVPGVAQATLPDGRKMLPGNNYTVDLDCWSKISNGARNTVVSVVSVNTAETNLWMSSNATVNWNTYLTTASATPITVPVGGMAAQGAAGGMFGPLPVGTTLRGNYGEKYMYIYNNDLNSTYDIAAGDVVVWSDKSQRFVTRARPAVTTLGAAGAFNVQYGASGQVKNVVNATEVGSFAGVAIGAIAHAKYGFIQVEGYCDSANSASNSVAAGAALSVDPANNGALVDASKPSITITPVSETVSVTNVTGVWTITWNSVTVSAISATVTAAVLGGTGATGLNNTSTGFASIAGTSVTVTGGPAANSTATPLVITITGPTATNSTVTSTASTVNPISTTFTLGLEQTYSQFPTSPIEGQFQASWNSANQTAANAILWDDTAAAVQTKLATITGLPGNVAIVGDGGGTFPTGTYEFKITSTTTSPVSVYVNDLVGQAAGAFSFGTAMVASGSNVVAGVDIRSEKKKTPYKRERNRN